MNKPTHALYKGDELIMVGTVDEIAKSEGVARDTVFFWASPTYKKRCKENYKIVIKLEDDDE